MVRIGSFADGKEAGVTGDRERLWRAFNPPPEHYDVRDTAPFAVTLAQRALRRSLVQGRWALGLCEGRDLVLLEIGRLDGSATSKQLRGSLGLSANSLSTVLRRSEELGYVVRDRDDGDGRSWRLSLTADGRRVAVRAAAMWREAEAALETGLSEGDVVWLRSLARRAGAAWLERVAADEEVRRSV